MSGSAAAKGLCLLCCQKTRGPHRLPVELWLSVHHRSSFRSNCARLQQVVAPSSCDIHPRNMRSQLGRSLAAAPAHRAGSLQASQLRPSTLQPTTGGKSGVAPGCWQQHCSTCCAYRGTFSKTASADGQQDCCFALPARRAMTVASQALAVQCKAAAKVHISTTRQVRKRTMQALTCMHTCLLAS